MRGDGERGKARAWILHAVAELSQRADGATCREILAACGRRCFPEELGARARQLWIVAPTIRAFAEAMHAIFPPVRVEGDDLVVVYPRCYCEQIADVLPSNVPDAYCVCSIGWVEELFRRATGIDAGVDAQSTIVRGGTECRFHIHLERGLDEPLR